MWTPKVGDRVRAPRPQVLGDMWTEHSGLIVDLEDVGFCRVCQVEFGDGARHWYDSDLLTKEN